MVQLPSDNNLDILSFNNTITKNLTNSYKLYWMYGIFEEVLRGSEVIDFQDIVCWMIAKNWFSTVKYKLWLGSLDKLYHLVIYLSRNYNIEDNISEASLTNEIKKLMTEEKDNNLIKMFQDMYKYVPYRCISSFFSKKLSGFSDHQKNRRIEMLTRDDENCLYKIYSSKKKIVINKKWKQYIWENQAIIKAWIHYNIINFLQTRNPNVPGIPFKIYPPRNRKSLQKQKNFWENIINYNNITDIYTGLPLNDHNFKNYGSLSLDHFIPWSFVLHDEVWNLVPTFDNINSQKSDKLPQLDTYLDRHAELQKIAVRTAINHNLRSKVIEDYLSIDGKLPVYSCNTKELHEIKFKNKLKSNIEPLYQIAKNQGFEVLNQVNVH